MQVALAPGSGALVEGLMRLKTELWVKAFIRQRQAAGAFAAVVAHGHDSAGAVLIKVSRLDGTAQVYGPAPMSLEAEAVDAPDRRFSRLHAEAWLAERDADAIVTRQRSYDEDVWVVEVEDRSGASGLDGAIATATDR
jgi:hypothetical protein